MSSADDGPSRSEQLDYMLKITEGKVWGLRQQIDELRKEVNVYRAALFEIAETGPRCDECSGTHRVIDLAEKALQNGERISRALHSS